MYLKNQGEVEIRQKTKSKKKRTKRKKLNFNDDIIERMKISKPLQNSTTAHLSHSLLF